MEAIKLNHEEQLRLSKKLEELNNIHQEAIAQGISAYQYDWQQLDRAVSQAVLEYRLLMATNECVKS